MTSLGICFIRVCVHRISRSQEGAAGIKKSAGNDRSSIYRGIGLDAGFRIDGKSDAQQFLDQFAFVGEQAL